MLKAIAQEFSARILRRDQGDLLAKNLAYGLTQEDIVQILGDGEQQERLQEVASLQYANQSQLNQFNKHQAIEMFGRGKNDTGSPEVQGMSCQYCEFCQSYCSGSLDGENRLLDETCREASSRLFCQAANC